MQENILKQNKNSWDSIADDWFGTTALPIYGELIPTETQLNLFGDVSGKRVLDIGCGSGHSLKYLADKDANELWGLDLSTKQIENAHRYLAGNGYNATLFNSAMEVNPGLPINYFDVVYSIYAIGWTTDIETTFQLISEYLKPGGIFIFSWDHPLTPCVELKGQDLILSKSYLNDRLFTIQKGGKDLSLYNRNFSDYINALAKAGFILERLVEETDSIALEQEGAARSKYYSPQKAKNFPLSFIIKAVKR